MAPCLPFLRPYTSPVLATRTAAQCSAYLQFYKLAKPLASRGPDRGARGYAGTRSTPEEEVDLSPAQRSAMRTQRIQKLKQANMLEYPRVAFFGKPTSVRAFRTQYQKASNEELSGAERYAVHGRVHQIRAHGKRLSFIPIVQDGCLLQIMLEYPKLTDGTDEKAFINFNKLLQRGDYISVNGYPKFSDSGQLGLLAMELPKLVSPSLVPLPHKISPELAVQKRHVDMLVNHTPREILIMRDILIRHLRAHIGKVLRCVEVQTPILAASAGGAVARPFTTQASEFPHKELALRIAPELWLKRLVVGGMDRVFEIGPSFRNEGVDGTHNPEFTTCEFYIAYANLHALMNMTQNIIYGLAKCAEQFKKHACPVLSVPETEVFKSRWAVVDFIPCIEAELGHALPDLESDTALPDLIALLESQGKDWHRSLPPNASLPKLLDHIAAAVIEPKSMGQLLFIKHHPVCMSPLSKSFKDGATQQHVAARAELFYNGHELANMYEEENDPFKQRAKFVAQAAARKAAGGAAADEDPAHVIDEQYLSVLESGLPPTGGWGAGIDRLIMLFTGAKRISDVLPFGNLRHVVGLAAGQHQQPDDVEQKEGQDARAVVRETRKAAILAKKAAVKEGAWKKDEYWKTSLGEDRFLEEVEEGREDEKELDSQVREILYRNNLSNVIEKPGSRNE